MSDLVALGVDDFPAWFAEVTGHAPFEWQTDLVRRADEQHQWPGLIDLPTGAGKTSTVDIAVFLMALDAERPAAERWMPRRLVFVVDRRVVVDQVFDQATRIAELLATAVPGTLSHAVADRLRYLAGTDRENATADPPLLVASLRGAITRDESWMRRPDVPAILSSTIDQAGSRLLFRGYGISDVMRPIHAGLLGNDTLWVLDEVHLARPFAQTLGQLRRYRQWRSDGSPMPDRWGVIEMSATPSTIGHSTDERDSQMLDGGGRFPDGEIQVAADSTLGRRLNARKPATLHEVALPNDRAKADAAFARACAQRAADLVAAGARRVAVIVNRVDTARAVYAAATADDLPAELLTGRMRPIDRDARVAVIQARLATGKDRGTDEEPLIVVATQCIEAGADLDFDAAVTEIASIDALKQRFGRVRRSGDVIETPHISTILARSTDLKDGVSDPIYGSALRATWDWLQGLDSVDFGVRHLPPVNPDDLPELFADRTGAPQLLPMHLDQLSQTSGPLVAEPDVSRWLHGDSDSAPDVYVIWRSDLDRELLSSEDVRTVSDLLTTYLSVCPPASTEMLAVPLNAARQWLVGQPVAEVSDADGLETTGLTSSLNRPSLPWVRWRDDKAELQEAVDDGAVSKVSLRSGDIVVVPSEYGGLTAGTWDPRSLEPVPDVATAALHRQGRLDVLRLTRGLVPRLRPEFKDVPFPSVTAFNELSVPAQRRAAVEFLQLLDRPEDLDTAIVEVMERIASHRHRLTVTLPGAGLSQGGASTLYETVIVSVPPAPSRVTSILTGPQINTGEPDDVASFVGAGVGLEVHQRGVAAWAAHLAGGLGLGSELVEDLERAGRFHDEGKRDPRFQLLLHGGDELAAAASEVALAKSYRREPSAASRARIREDSKYPSGARHELTSLAIAGAELDQAHDADLVRHLVASHHGWCRPFGPAVIDDDPVLIETAAGERVASDHGMHRIDAGPPERFWRLTRRYGWYRLAWLEAILRLGDHRESEQEALSAEGGSHG